MSNLLRINDCMNFDRFYFDLLLDTASMDDFKFVELYSAPYYFDKSLSLNKFLILLNGTMNASILNLSNIS